MENSRSSAKHNICRSCLKSSPECFLLRSSRVEYSLLRVLVPEIVYLSVSVHPVICASCYDFLQSVDSFRAQCLRTEKLINKYMSDTHQTTGLYGSYLKLEHVVKYWKKIYRSEPYCSEIPRAYLAELFESKDGEVLVPEANPSETSPGPTFKSPRNKIVKIVKVASVNNIENVHRNNNDKQESSGLTFFEKTVVKPQIRVRSDASLLRARISPLAGTNINGTEGSRLAKIAHLPELPNGAVEITDLNREAPLLAVQRFPTPPRESIDHCKIPELPPINKQICINNVPFSDQDLDVIDVKEEPLCYEEDEGSTNQFDQNPDLPDEPTRSFSQPSLIGRSLEDTDENPITPDVPTINAGQTSLVENGLEDTERSLVQFAPSGDEGSTKTSEVPVRGTPQRKRARPILDDPTKRKRFRKGARPSVQVVSTKKSPKTLDKSRFRMLFFDVTSEGDFINDHDYLLGPYDRNNMRIKRSQGYASWCLLCNTTQANSKHASHMRRHSTQCSICKEDFHNVFLLNLHARRHIHDYSNCSADDTDFTNSLCLNNSHPPSLTQSEALFAEVGSTSSQQATRVIEEGGRSSIASCQNQQESDEFSTDRIQPDSEENNVVNQINSDGMEFISLADLSSDTSAHTNDFPTESPLINHIHVNLKEPQDSQTRIALNKRAFNKSDDPKKTDECQKNEPVIVSEDKAGLYKYYESNTAAEMPKIIESYSEETIPKQASEKKSSSESSSEGNANPKSVDSPNMQSPSRLNKPAEETVTKSLVNRSLRTLLEEPENLVTSTKKPSVEINLDKLLCSRIFLEEVVDNFADMSLATNLAENGSPHWSTLREEAVTFQRLIDRQRSPIFVANPNEFKPSRLDDIDDPTIVKTHLKETEKNSVEYDKIDSNSGLENMPHIFDATVQNTSKLDTTVRSAHELQQPINWQDKSVEDAPKLAPSNRSVENPENADNPSSSLTISQEGPVKSKTHLSTKAPQSVFDGNHDPVIVRTYSRKKSAVKSSLNTPQPLSLLDIDKSLLGRGEADPEGSLTDTEKSVANILDAPPAETFQNSSKLNTERCSNESQPSNSVNLPEKAAKRKRLPKLTPKPGIKKPRCIKKRLGRPPGRQNLAKSVRSTNPPSTADNLLAENKSFNGKLDPSFVAYLNEALQSVLDGRDEPASDNLQKSIEEPSVGCEEVDPEKNSQSVANIVDDPPEETVQNSSKVDTEISNESQLSNSVNLPEKTAATRLPKLAPKRGIKKPQGIKKCLGRQRGRPPGRQNLARSLPKSVRGTNPPSREVNLLVENKTYRLDPLPIANLNEALQSVFDEPTSDNLQKYFEGPSVEREEADPEGSLANTEQDNEKTSQSVTNIMDDPPEEALQNSSILDTERSNESHSSNSVNLPEKTATKRLPKLAPKRRLKKPQAIKKCLGRPRGRPPGRKSLAKSVCSTNPPSTVDNLLVENKTYRLDTLPIANLSKALQSVFDGTHEPTSNNLQKSIEEASVGREQSAPEGLVNTEQDTEKTSQSVANIVDDPPEETLQNSSKLDTEISNESQPSSSVNLPEKIAHKRKRLPKLTPKPGIKKSLGRPRGRPPGRQSLAKSVSCTNPPSTEDNLLVENKTHRLDPLFIANLNKALQSVFDGTDEPTSDNLQKCIEESSVEREDTDPEGSLANTEQETEKTSQSVANFVDDPPEEALQNSSKVDTERSNEWHPSNSVNLPEKTATKRLLKRGIKKPQGIKKYLGRPRGRPPGRQSLAKSVCSTNPPSRVDNLLVENKINILDPLPITNSNETLQSVFDGTDDYDNLQEYIEELSVGLEEANLEGSSANTEQDTEKTSQSVANIGDDLPEETLQHFSKLDTERSHESQSVNLPEESAAKRLPKLPPKRRIKKPQGIKKRGRPSCRQSLAKSARSTNPLSPIANLNKALQSVFDGTDEPPSDNLQKCIEEPSVEREESDPEGLANSEQDSEKTSQSVVNIVDDSPEETLQNSSKISNESQPSSSGHLPEKTAAKRKRLPKFTPKLGIKKPQRGRPRGKPPGRQSLAKSVRGTNPPSTEDNLLVESKTHRLDPLFIANLNNALQSVFDGTDEPTSDNLPRYIEEPSVGREEAEGSLADISTQDNENYNQNVANILENPPEETFQNPSRLHTESSNELQPSSSVNLPEITAVKRLPKSSRKPGIHKLQRIKKCQGRPRGRANLAKSVHSTNPPSTVDNPLVENRSSTGILDPLFEAYLNEALQSGTDEPTSDNLQKSIEEPSAGGERCDSRSSFVDILNDPPEETLKNSPKIDTENSSNGPQPSSSDNPQKETLVTKSPSRRLRKIPKRYRLTATPPPIAVKPKKTVDSNRKQSKNLAEKPQIGKKRKMGVSGLEASDTGADTTVSGEDTTVSGENAPALEMNDIQNAETIATNPIEATELARSSDGSLNLVERLGVDAPKTPRKSPRKRVKRANFDI